MSTFTIYNIKIDWGFRTGARVRTQNIWQKHAGTYRTEGNDLTRTFPSNFFLDTIEVEDKLRECLPVMPLPLANGVQGVRRRLLRFGPFCLGLALLVSSRHQLLLERTGMRIVGPPGKELRIGAMVDGRPCSGRRPCVWFRRFRYLLLRRWLAKGDLDLSRSTSFGRHKPCPVGRVGGIGHVGEGSASRHVQGGLGRRGDEYSGHAVTIAVSVERMKDSAGSMKRKAAV